MRVYALKVIDRSFHDTAKFIFPHDAFWHLFHVQSYRFSPRRFRRYCNYEGIGNAHHNSFHSRMALKGYDSSVDKRCCFLALALCGIYADGTAREWMQTKSLFSGETWLYSLFFCARAWESPRFQHSLQELLQRVSPCTGLSLVAPELLSSLWSETTADLGKVSYKEGSKIHNVVANWIDSRCSVEHVYQLGSLSLLHFDFGGYIDWRFTHFCSGFDARRKLPSEPKAFTETMTTHFDGHFLGRGSTDWLFLCTLRSRNKDADLRFRVQG